MREKMLFDDNWMFHKGDINYEFPKVKGPTYMQSKTERMLWGPASVHYNSNPNSFSADKEVCVDKWEYVNLPHDYIITQEPKECYNNALGFFKYENAWYRKNFTVDKSDMDKRIVLYFEGVATHATVYLNGCLMKHNFCGYTSFEVDITDVVKFDEENVLSVYVCADKFEGWWYNGGGIYRHVWLIKTDSVAVDMYGVYAAPKKLSYTKWTVNLETTVRNDRYEDVNAQVVSTIFDENGNEVVKSDAQLNISCREKNTVKYAADVENPMLWDIDDTHLYTVVTDVFVNGEKTDSYSTRFGFRTFVLDPEKGLFLNGRHVKIKGLCAHQDFGITGRAVPDNIHRYKIEMLKEMGANGYRTSHYPHSESTMDALDELGFIVMNETRWFESTDEGRQQLEFLVKRDRNRPSVLFWSVGNEEPHHLTEQGRRICKNLMALVRKLDNTRIVMTAVSNDPDKATVYDELDSIGVNYNLDKYDYLHQKYPEKTVFASECCATGTTRGWYNDDCPEKGYINALDKDTDRWFLGREKTWKFICEREWVLGSYQWIGFEHRGEAMWPRLCSASGAIDLFLQKKDAFYQNQTHWIEDRPLVHLAPHWNFKGREGEPIRVWAYTNCDELELYLNGKSLGKQSIEKYGHGQWTVDYQPGKLVVEARINGKTVCVDSAETTGRPIGLKLKTENKVTDANGRDIAIITCSCIDENGNEVPDASPFVRFNCNKLGKIVGTGSDNCDHVPVNITDRQMWAGKITVAVLVGKCPGELKVYASSDNLNGAVATIPLK